MLDARYSLTLSPYVLECMYVPAEKNKSNVIVEELAACHALGDGQHQRLAACWITQLEGSSRANVARHTHGE